MLQTFVTYQDPGIIYETLNKSLAVYFYIFLCFRIGEKDEDVGWVTGRGKKSNNCERVLQPDEANIEAASNYSLKLLLIIINVK